MGMKPRPPVGITWVIGDVIAERNYEILTEDGRKRAVVLRFGRPLEKDEAEFRCAFQIQVVGEPEAKVRGAFGGDAVQALQLAMELAHVELVCSKAYAAGRLTWLGHYDLGLPVLEPIKDRIKYDPKLERIKEAVAAKHHGPPKRRS